MYGSETEVTLHCIMNLILKGAWKEAAALPSVKKSLWLLQKSEKIFQNFTLEPEHWVAIATRKSTAMRAKIPLHFAS